MNLVIYFLFPLQSVSLVKFIVKFGSREARADDIMEWREYCISVYRSRAYVLSFWLGGSDHRACRSASFRIQIQQIPIHLRCARKASETGVTRIDFPLPRTPTPHGYHRWWLMIMSPMIHQSTLADDKPSLPVTCHC